MKTKNLRFLFMLACLGLILMGLTFGLLQVDKVSVWITKFWSLLILFFVAVGVAVYFLAERVKKRDMRKFANFFMIATVVKLVLYLAIILVYASLIPSDAKAFMLTFLTYYICFSIYETYALTRRK